ncbi:hypothetical protein [Sphingomonas sp.]|uniref:hypothetical protein n=1 Tax=Sphingomonas sp. TaxID=28214 RepID=UPI000DB80031|nr:hypothetical protein [Sphingomonas sp.]PZU10934.1 MAG: hypothetical protein DI605_04790 [Sphingomonas sp.]
MILQGSPENIVIVTASSTTVLQRKLESSGLSSAKADLVQSDLNAAVADAGGSGAAKPASVREALDKRIAADVASGKLSESDATDIRKTLDKMGDASVTASADTTSPTTASSTAGQASAGKGGGGGGGGEASKTELSRTVTVAGTVKTTIITYTDGTSETTTSTASSADKSRYGKAAQSADRPTTPDTYLASIEPGSLMDTAA